MNYREALQSMVWQFGYKGQKAGEAVIHTGGLSVLEDAFEALGWPDPYVVVDGPWICDVNGCAGWTVSQGIGWPETGYWYVCRDHAEAHREGHPQPPMKLRALDREARRGPDGVMPNR